MGRVMAIDYGSKRTGLAVTDPDRIIATGLATIPSSDVLKYLQEYFSREKVDIIVVGEPKNMDNTASDSARFIEPFVRSLKNRFKDMKIERMDERFTSKMAFQTILDSGIKKMDRRNKGLIDEVSAVIILQSYLQKIQGF